MTDKFINNIRRIDDKNWYWISHSILKQYGRVLKGSGLAVYNVFASYANSKSQTCFPTQKTIAERLGLSRRTVSRKVRMLKDLNLVKVRRTRSRCIYFLLRPDTPNGIHQIRQKRHIRYATSGVYNKNYLTRINNKNNREDGFNNFKPIRRLLKRYGQRTE
jgi:DNA-binding MarR family transcriptional regulator